MITLETLAKAFDAAAERAATILNDGTVCWNDKHDRPIVAYTADAVLAARRKEVFEELAAIARGEGQ